MEDSFQVIENYLMVRMPEEIDHHKSVYISKKADDYIMQSGVGNVVFDFEDTKFMDSSGIAVALRGWQRMREVGGSVMLRHVAKQPRKVFEASGVGRMMTIE